jgi:hypothetical protein
MQFIITNSRFDLGLKVLVSDGTLIWKNGINEIKTDL